MPTKKNKSCNNTSTVNSDGTVSTPLGNFVSAVPGNPGIARLKCVLYENKPFVKRPYMDINFIFSRDTVASLGREYLNKFSFFGGNNGLFLKEQYNYRNSYLSCFSYGSKNITKLYYLTGTKNDTINISDLIFLSPAREDIQKDVVQSDGKIVSITQEANHQTWVLEGSLFSHFYEPFNFYNIDALTASSSVLYGTENVITMKYTSTWRYYVPSESGKANDGKTNTNSFVICPMQIGVCPGNPVKDILSLPDNLMNKFFDKRDTFMNINPGIHWRTIKKSKLFQGEDFFVELIRGSYEKDTPDLSVPKTTVGVGGTYETKYANIKPKFKLRNFFAPLDVHATPTGDVNGCIINAGVLEVSENNGILNITESGTKKFDFSNQRYFILEIGVGHEEHNYFMILCDNANPTLIHVGRSPTISYSTSSSGDSSNPEKVTKMQVVTPDFPVSRKISEYNAVSSKDLLNKERLRITVQNFMGKLVFTFSGHENNPWIVQRQDPSFGDSFESSSITTGEVIPQPFINNITYNQVPMVVPKARISLYGGNQRMGYIFGPMQYSESARFNHPQSMQIFGDANKTEEENKGTCIYLRDKGYSISPKVSSKNIPIQFTNDAGRFGEMINDKNKDTQLEKTMAIKVQAEQVKSYGKAPDIQQKASEKDGLYKTKIPDGKGNQKDVSVAVSYISATRSSDYSYPNKDSKYISSFFSSVELWAGDYLFQEDQDESITDLYGNDSSWLLENCITPICLGYRINIPEYGTSYDATPIDVSHHVMSFNDSWNAEDYRKINHTGDIRFLVSDCMQFKNGTTDLSAMLSSLVDKAFYVQISAWWELPDGGLSIMPCPKNSWERVIFTGICYGGVIETKAGQKFMNCKVYDYMKPMEDKYYTNGPFFDKMRDFNAVLEILKFCEFRTGKAKRIEDIDSSQPASLMQYLSDINITGYQLVKYNEEVIRVREYALPGSYDILQNPFLKAKDGDKPLDMIEKISKLSGKVYYFDSLGVFHYENLPDEPYLFNTGQIDPNSEIQNAQCLSKIDYYASPLNIKNTDCVDLHRQVFDVYTMDRNVKDIYNEIQVVSADYRSGALLIGGDMNIPSINDYSSAGFLGYTKQFLQMDGVFGTEEAVKNIVKHYTRFYTPPVMMSFSSLGHNKLKPMDIITFTGLGSSGSTDRTGDSVDKQPLRITAIENNIDPQKNTWIQKITAEWMFAGKNVNWGGTPDSGTSKG